MNPGTTPENNKQRAMPLVSVIVPCYNVEHWAERCIRSLLSQTHPSLEVVAVNDCSTDGTGALLDRMAATDERLRPVHMAKNVGLHAARRAGLKEAKGEFIGFVDGDDHVAADMYGTLAGALLHSNADIALGGYRTMKWDGTVSRTFSYPKVQLLEEGLLVRFARGDFGSGVIWSKLYQRSIIEPGLELQLDRRLDSGADYIVGVGCFASARQVVTVPGTPYRYDLRPESMSMAKQGAAAFVFQLECYMTCLDVYADRNEQVQQAIDDLYGRQLCFDCYRVERPEDLTPFQERLSAILQALARLRPQALYALVHAFDKAHEPAPPMPPRFHLGQVRISLVKAIKAFIKGRA